jgi:nitroimidazol reductase NimA-like FMN-containing flavoprotein (pyridoxamine 5'-phosphate oxidase superfamily)
MAALSKSDIVFIQNLPVCRVATSTKDCIPVVRPVWHIFDGKNIYFATDPGLPKLKHIEANPNVSVVFDDYDRNDWTKIKGILIRGKAEVLWKDEEYKHAHRLLKEKYPEYRTEQGGWEEGETPIVKVEPLHASKWVYGKWKI